MREAEFDGWRQMPAPADRFRTRGVVYRGNSFGGDQAVVQPSGDSLTGIGCCPGVVRGPVHLVRDPRDTAAKAGEIVVADRTDPGWVAMTAGYPRAIETTNQSGRIKFREAASSRTARLPGTARDDGAQ